MLNGQDPEQLIESPPSRTYGFNLQSFRLERTSFIIWDCGGSQEYRALWQYYYKNIEGIVFVLDASNHARIDESGQEMINALNNETLNGTPMLILLHKSDSPDCMSLDFVVEYFGLNDINDRPWKILPSSILHTQTIDEGVSWLLSHIN